MSRLRAPTDLRMPISWVRSVTTASMMFMITTPPTTRNTETTATAVAADDLLSRVDAVNLEHVLGDIQTDRGNLHVDGSSHVIRLQRTTLWHLGAGSGRRPPHHKQTHAPQH